MKLRRIAKQQAVFRLNRLGTDHRQLRHATTGHRQLTTDNPQQMIDTIASSHGPASDRNSEVLDRASVSGVSRMVTIGTSLEDDRAAIAVCKGREFL